MEIYDIGSGSQNVELRPVLLNDEAETEPLYTPATVSYQNQICNIVGRSLTIAGSACIGSGVLIEIIGAAFPARDTAIKLAIAGLVTLTSGSVFFCTGSMIRDYTN